MPKCDLCDKKFPSESKLYYISYPANSIRDLGIVTVSVKFEFKYKI